jgi:hypothetical protein
VRLRGLLLTGVRLLGAGFVVGTGAALAGSGWANDAANGLIAAGAADVGVFALYNIMAPGRPLRGIGVKTGDYGVRVWRGGPENEPGERRPLPRGNGGLAGQGRWTSPPFAQGITPGLGERWPQGPVYGHPLVDRAGVTLGESSAIYRPETPPV